VRIIAGAWRGRRIAAPAGEAVRPTADRVREAWMSIVSLELTGAKVLDLFAGSGALGLEALSRGAASVDFVENSAKSIAAIRKNAAVLGAEPRMTIHRADAMRFVESVAAHEFDVAFADPPYGEALATRLAEQWLTAPFASVLGIEHRLDEHLPGAGSEDRRRYGDTVITFFRV
jgi:16S rRNA (guanine966-N2)-methyltransferase